MVTLLVVSGVRGRADLITEQPLTWVFAFGFPGLLLALVAWYLVIEHRRGRAATGGAAMP